MKRSIFHRILSFGVLWITTTALSYEVKAQEPMRNGMVVSDNLLASRVGQSILRKGGNAIDAAVATAFALAVTHPQAGNLGGGGFLVFMNDEGACTSIDFREKAPLSATTNMFLDKDGQLIAGSNHKGAKSIGVPGTVAGLWLSHQKFGKLDWAELVAPSVALAKNGFALTPTLAKHGKDPALDEASAFMRNFFDGQNGEVLDAGDNWKQPELAKTLALIQKHGKAGFYEGKVAEEIERFMQANGGLITKEDLMRYEAIERRPIHGTYKGYDIYSMAPPSSGGIAMIEMLNMLEQAPMEEIEFHTAEYYHLISEVMRRAYADRAEHLGDPDFNPEIPVDLLCDKSHALKHYQSIDPFRASISDSSNFTQLYDGKNTTHLSVMDKDGNGVSLTYTLEHSYGAKIGSKKLGFIFNNEMGDFNPQVGLTNSKGLIGTSPNLIAPEKRMLSSMSPTIVSKNDKPYLVIGSPGGRTIINTVFQTVLMVVQYDMQIEEAIEAPKIHHQWLPDRIYYEDEHMNQELIQNLEYIGHETQSKRSLGRLMGIIYDAESESFYGHSDTSSPDGAAVGY